MAHLAGEIADILPGAKAPPGPGQEDGPNLIIFVSVLQRLADPSQHLIGQRIQLLRPVEGNRRHTVLGLIENKLGLRHCFYSFFQLNLRYNISGQATMEVTTVKAKLPSILHNAHLEGASFLWEA